MQSDDSARQPAGLPEGVEYPRRYIKARKARRWFQVGAWDGAANRPLAAEADVRQSGGPSAWVAYQRGYDAGQQQRAAS
ncbi:MAG: hypothetical protein KKA73_24440 [Chloroflexi bacterium]|nr:hypothetical protein [Chloroflexota bacterium]MBU1750843.1 hypothetical protein [Chloroflexota bacterium]MBU1879965.1 hypothetical protein [Chloroflexota bacterium]